MLHSPEVLLVGSSWPKRPPNYETMYDDRIISGVIIFFSLLVKHNSDRNSCNIRCKHTARQVEYQASEKSRDERKKQRTIDASKAIYKRFVLCNRDEYTTEKRQIERVPGLKDRLSVFGCKA